MENRIAIIGIFIHNNKSVGKLNDLLNTYSSYIVGRMGVPYREKQISVISIIIDAPKEVIAALSGKIGMIPDVNVKAVYSKKQEEKCQTNI